jgi:TonB family protein
MTRLSAPGGAPTLPWCLFVLALMMSARLAAAQGMADAGDVNGGTLYFDLQAQPLETALARFGRITGHSVLVASSLTAGRQAAAVNGEFAPREALRRMLDGTGLVARYSGADAFTLMPETQGDASDEARARAEVQARVARAAETAQAVAQASYAQVLQRSITRVLCIAQPDAFGRFRLGLQLWIDADGRVEDTRLLEGSGIPERDSAVLSSLRALALDAPPPRALAQPLTILLTPRADPGRDCRAFVSRAPLRAR